jgi:hypothetical protein
MPWEVGIERTSDGVSAAGAPIVIMIMDMLLIHVVASQSSLTLSGPAGVARALSVALLVGSRKYYDPFIVKTQTSPSESNE